VIRLPFIAAFAILAIAACSNRGPVDVQAKADAPLPEINAPAPSALGEPHGNTVPAKPEPAPAARIPAALQGRWALDPTDCSSPPNRAKGLLVVTPTLLRFYESRAVPASDIGFDESSIGGNFAFNGEGRSWTKYEALKVANHRLTRTEINPTASFSYAKCS